MKKNKGVQNLLVVVLALLGAAAAPLGGADSSAYASIMNELGSQPHRQPGSSEFSAAAGHIERILKAAGLDPQRQTFNTLVPVIDIQMTVDGEAVTEGVHGFSDTALATTDGKTLTGRTLYVAEGDEEDLSGKIIADRIVVCELGSGFAERAFQLKARAVLVVGNDTASQWDRMDVIPHSPVIFIEREQAQELQLLTAERDVTLRIDSRFEERIATNLWVSIPGTGLPDDARENVVFSATLDTMGKVPTLCPAQRNLANVALLTQTLVDLAEQKPSRGVIGVFFGSHWAAQEGSRYFHWVNRRVRDPGTDPLEDRAASYQDSLDNTEDLIEFFQRDDFLQRTDLEVFPEASKMMRSTVDDQTNAINYRLSQIYRDIRRLRTEEMDTEKAGEPVRETLTGDREELIEIREELKVLQKAWQEMARQVVERDRELDPEIAKDENITEELIDSLWDELLLRVRGKLQRRVDQFKALQQHNASFLDLAEAFRYRDADAEGEDQQSHIPIMGHFHWDFANDENQWLFNMAGNFRGHLEAKKFNLGGFKKHLGLIGDAYEGVYEPSWEARLNAEALKLHLRPDSLCTPGLRSLACVPALACGIYGYNLTTIGAPLHHDEMPQHEEADLSGLRAQSVAVASIFANEPSLSLPYRNTPSKFKDQAVMRYDGDEWSGVRFLLHSKGGEEVMGPASRAIVSSSVGSRGGELPVPGHLRHGFASTTQEGFLFLPNIDTNAFDSGAAVEFDEYGRKIRRHADRFKGKKVVYLKFGYHAAFGSNYFPNEYDVITPPEFLVAASNSKFNPQTEAASVSMGGGSVMMSREDQRWKMVSSLNSNTGLMLLGAEAPTAEDPDEARKQAQGYGISNDPGETMQLDPVSQSSRDYAHINEHRLQILRKRGIISDAAETLHADAADYRDAGADLRKQGQVPKAEAKEVFALVHDYRAYEPVRAVSADMVQAVIILMILTIPFAFVMERLVVGATSIYKQIGGFIAIFVGTFLILRQVHPAFELAAEPTVIFLAFVILVMSGMVIYVVLSKFKLELMALQGMASKSHGDQRSSSTVLASVFIGISGMRNRPMKTALTATTVVLLTFTILVFASFNSSVGVVETYLGQGSGAKRIEVQRSSFLPIPERLVQSIEEEYEADYHVFRRGAVFQDPMLQEDREAMQVSVYNPTNGKSARLQSVLALDPREAQVNPDLARVVPGWADTDSAVVDRGIQLTEYLANDLGLSIGDPVVVRGIQFQLAGYFEEGVLQSASYMSGGRVLPPDFEATMQERDLQGGGGSVDEITKIDTSSFKWSRADGIGIISVHDLAPFEQSRKLTNVVMLYPKTDVDIDEAAHGIATVFIDSVFARGSEGAKSYFFTLAFQGSGFGEVIVPLLLGGLIIFSSLLGSIVDREREIFTFSALGLAPPNVAALFFAESTVYAVIGGVGGYVISQVVAYSLNFMAGLGWFQPPEMNFSSLSSTYTILVVMATVILSTIYPAIQAGKSANPGIARKWKMPAPTSDNKLDFVFPFTVSSKDMVGILSFIKEHFENHSDATLGSFAAQNVHVRRVVSESEDQDYAIEAEISLAPFDLGIFQSFRMSSRDSDIEGIKEVVVECQLANGSPGAWLRSSRTFIADLRKQFLLWRSLPADSVAHYCQHTIDDAESAARPAVSQA